MDGASAKQYGLWEDNSSSDISSCPEASLETLGSLSLLPDQPTKAQCKSTGHSIPWHFIFKKMCSAGDLQGDMNFSFSQSVLVILQIFSFGADFRSSTVSSQQNRSHMDMYHVQQPSCFLKASVDLNWWIIVSTWNYTFLVDWVPKF